MTKAEILDQIIEKKREELVVLKESYTKIQKERDFKYFQTIKDYFGGSNITIEDVSIKEPSYGTTFEIVRPHPDFSYDKELMTLRLSENWREKGFKDITTSVYSTSSNDNWELERLIVVGQVANILLDYKDDILAELNGYTEMFSKKYSKAFKLLKQCESDISILASEKNETYLDEAKSLLNGEGLNFDGDKKGTIDLRWDWTIRGITSAKILSKTISGKSANIEITTHGDNPRTFEKVRMSNIDTLLWQYRDYVLTA
jgi:hypothetical protein